jgi:hypothetical protein
MSEEVKLENKNKEIKEEEIKIEEKNQKKDIYNDNLNSGKECFLYMFKPEKVEVDFICGYSLFVSVKIISIILIILGMLDVLMTYLNTNFFNFLESFIYSVLYLVSGIYLFISTINFEYNDAFVGYKLYESLFLFELLLFLLKIILISIGLIHPLGEGRSFVKKFSLYLGVGICAELIKLYLLWVVFSYFVHLKLKRIKIILLLK